MSEKGLIVRGSTQLRAARAEVGWVSDEDLDELEDREPYAAGAMSIALPGSGHIYNHDYKVGFGVAAAAVATIALVPFGWIAYLGAGAVMGALAFKKARKVNRFVKARWREQQHPEHGVKSTRLLNQMNRPGIQPTAAAEAKTNVGAVAPSGQFAPLAATLRKLATLHRSGMITDLEFDERKIDTLQEAATALPRDLLDDLLFALMPLRNEGSLSDSDIESIKSLSP